MKELTSNEIRKIQLKILDALAVFCADNDIKYFLSSGTLLGAVRHKGYIPWDDDIDVMMLRKDYLKFYDLYEKSETEYKLLTHGNTPNYNNPFIKMSDKSTILIEDRFSKVNIGANIDIFPIDNIPQKNQSLFYIKLKFIRNLLKLKTYEGKYEKRFLWKFMLTCGRFSLFFLPVKWILKKLDKLTQKDYKDSNLSGLTVWGYLEKEICRSEVFDNSTTVEFEGKSYSAPQLYHEYLTNIYGNYMTLPPPEKRVSPHSFKVYTKTENC